MNYNEFFEYNDIKVEGKTRLTPSSFCNFYESAGDWYKTQILKENTFVGNTNTVVGSILHARIGAYWSGVKVDEDVELEYISQYDDNPEVDCWKVSDDVKRLFDAIVESVPTFLANKPEEVEKSLQFEIPDSDIFIGGTLDYLRHKDLTIGDIKTTSTTPKKIKFSHKVQIYLYELIRRMNDLNPMENIEVFYIVKLKTPKCIILTEPIDEEFMEYVKQEVKNMVIRLNMVKDKPELVDIIFPINKDSYL